MGPYQKRNDEKSGHNWRVWPELSDLGKDNRGSIRVFYSAAPSTTLVWRFPAPVTQKPLELIVVAFVDTVIMGYLVTASRWKGRMESLALFSAFYGVNYALTTIEAVYLPTVLPASARFSLLLKRSGGLRCSPGSGLG